MKNRNSFLSIAILLFVIVFASCRKNNDGGVPIVVNGPDVNFYALTTDNRLLYVNGESVGVAESTLSITGLQSGETLLGIDFRPQTGQLFSIGSTSRLYTINTQTGVATAIGTAPFTPAISGNVLGFDFNPTVDRLRLVTSTGQNLRLNPENGTVAFTDGNINGAANASITDVAYTQSKAGATATILFDIDVTNDKLFKQSPPNDGTLSEVGSLGIDAQEGGGFDISFDSAYALAALKVKGVMGLYTINLSTGAATLAGAFSVSISGIAIPTDPVAYAISSSNSLLIMNPNTAAVSFTKPVTGLQPSENLLGLDMRPATGQLYAMGSSNRLYTINAGTGAATMVGTTEFYTSLSGSDFGFDFNPTVDRIRVVSTSGQNLRLNPIDGTVAAVDSSINPAGYGISAVAYTNSFAGATTTTLYDIDCNGDRLTMQNPPNNGTMVDVGSLGIDATASNGFDIGGTSGKAWAIITVGSNTNLYSINLTTGAATAGPAVASGVRGFTLGLGL